MRLHEQNGTLFTSIYMYIDRIGSNLPGADFAKRLYMIISADSVGKTQA